ncbi:CocE/NonD family hydrolase [Peristeroidobacter soli]|uniref:CocE/NonD family hydrolase n=1 Tax=Peristeroidobacter soli TaxID=2497877 RepID=UPI00101DE89C|nr:CocE/NonD family hydrolase [Peristeroidobacter soli]
MRFKFGVMSVLAVVGTCVLSAANATDSASDLTSVSDFPKEFKAPAVERDYTKRVEMIPMRDGVKLHTIIMVPKGARNAPILLTRTPYNAAARIERSKSRLLVNTLALSDEEFAKAGYIRVFQDVRGKYGSEGDYVMMWPVRGPLNSAKVDHTTDTWDTIEWLVKNLSESNGRVGMIGSSYEGFTTAIALMDPHPALKAAVPESPVMDGWMGDDWFHNGAFRQMMLPYIYMQTSSREAGIYSGLGGDASRNTHDDYDTFLRAGSAGDYVRTYGFDQLPWVARAMAHPAYDAFWQGQALDKLLAARPSKVPTLWEQGLWDSDDIYGANQAWRAQKAAGKIDNNWLVMGPWKHSQVNGTGYEMGPLKWEGDTSKQYNRDMVLPFFEHYLRDGPDHKLPRVTVYNTGENRWEHFNDWPTACERGCATGMKALYIREGSTLSFEAPTASGQQADTYTSDPAKPVPFIPRPILDPFSNMAGGSWSGWGDALFTDQRFVDGRPDVLTYETPVLTEPVGVQGIPIVDLRAMTTGSDGDFVVKLIDVYPADYPNNPKMRGYQLPIAMDILRGRYRTSFEHPSAIPPNKPQQYRFELPNVNHVFQPGHRIMVQIQSTLFPAYDRNPQTYVPNIFNAKPGDYRKAQISVLRSQAQPSAVLLPVVK